MLRGVAPLAPLLLLRQGIPRRHRTGGRQVPCEPRTSRDLSNLRLGLRLFHCELFSKPCVFFWCVSSVSRRVCWGRPADHAAERMTGDSAKARLVSVLKNSTISWFIFTMQLHTYLAEGQFPQSRTLFCPGIGSNPHQLVDPTSPSRTVP